ncbi:MAG: RIO1 family regulatory kinase/ATPase [Woeseiaceae bacterium]
MGHPKLLKKDLFGEVWLSHTDAEAEILRDTNSARWWLKWLARALLRREAAGLRALEGLDGMPRLLRCGGGQLARSYVAGMPMHVAKPSAPAYFRSAMRLLRRMHRAGVVHNDLAKEPNLLVRDDGTAAFIDFQLAGVSHARGRLFRMAAREDIRHVLKHKRTYCPQELTTRELGILARPSTFSRAWMGLFKPVYLFVTRRIFGWSDREGAGDRGQQG